MLFPLGRQSYRSTQYKTLFFLSSYLSWWGFFSAPQTDTQNVRIKNVSTHQGWRATCRIATINFGRIHLLDFRILNILFVELRKYWFYHLQKTKPLRSKKRYPKYENKLLLRVRGQFWRPEESGVLTLLSLLPGLLWPGELVHDSTPSTFKFSKNYSNLIGHYTRRKFFRNNFIRIEMLYTNESKCSANNILL